MLRLCSQVRSYNISQRRGAAPAGCCGERHFRSPAALEEAGLLASHTDLATQSVLRRLLDLGGVLRSVLRWFFREELFCPGLDAISPRCPQMCFPASPTYENIPRILHRAAWLSAGGCGHAGAVRCGFCLQTCPSGTEHGCDASSRRVCVYWKPSADE